MRAILRFLLILLGIAFVAWITACGFLLWQRHALIYPFADWPRAENVSGLPGANVQRIQSVGGIDILTWTVQVGHGCLTFVNGVGVEFCVHTRGIPKAYKKNTKVIRVV